MEIRLIKNFTKGIYRAVNDELMLAFVDDNRAFNSYAGKRIYLFNPSKNVRVEIAPELPKYDIFKIYHGKLNKKFFIFTSLSMVNEKDVCISYYCYNITSMKYTLVHTDTVPAESIEETGHFKIFALTEDYCMFQRFDTQTQTFDIVLKDIVADKEMRLANEDLVANGLDSIVPLGGNRCCFKIGNKLIGIVNVNQFVSDMVLNLPLVFTEMLDTSNGEVSFTEFYDNNQNICYTRAFPENGTEEVVIYDYRNNVKRVRQNDISSEHLDYRRMCVIGDVPYVYYTDSEGTHFINLNSQREDYTLSCEYTVEYVFGEYVITSRNLKLQGLFRKKSGVIEVFKLPDISHHVYRKRGIYNGAVVLADNLLLFVV